MIHATKGIVLRTVKYGDTSIITTVYTELFGIQSYIVKGVRQSSKSSAGKAAYFQPAAILDMEVYHNTFKQLQFVKEYQWHYLYENVLNDVIKHAVAVYIIELLHNSIRQPEANPELFYLITDTLQQLDKGSEKLTANLPLYFALHLGAELGFKMQGTYSTATPILDLQEGMFVSEKPTHPYYLEGDYAKISSALMHLNFYNDLETLSLNQSIRRVLIPAYQDYLALHIAGFGEMKSLSILQTLLD